MYGVLSAHARSWCAVTRRYESAVGVFALERIRSWQSDVALRMRHRMVVPIAVVNQWFSKRKGLAIGIVMSFSSWGSICWPLIISSLPSRIGWGWTVRLIGFIQLLLLSLAIWLLKTRLPPKPSGPIIYLKALSFRRPAYLLLCISCMSFTFSFFFFLFYIGSYAQQYGYGTKGYVGEISDVEFGLAWR